MLGARHWSRLVPERGQFGKWEIYPSFQNILQDHTFHGR